MSGIPASYRTKEALTGMSLGAVSLMLIISFIYPSMMDNNNAIGELQIQDAIQKTNFSNLITSSMILSKNQNLMDDKLDKLIIIACQQSNSSLCS